jgi:low affinity Fe/Cu permease
MMVAYPESVAELLRRRLAEQVRNLDRLRILSERQRDFLQNRDLERAAEQEAEKQRLLSVIRRRDQEINSLRQRRDRNVSDPSSEVEREIRSLSAQLEQRVRQVMEVESDNVTLVRQLRNEVERQLQNVIGGRKGVTYPTRTEQTGRFLDTEM